MRTTILPMIAISILALTPIHTAKGVNTESVFTKETNDNSGKKKKITFSEGMKAVERDGKWGFINKAKKMVIPYEYDEVRPFEDGLAMVRTGEVWGYIDKSGKTVIPFEYDDVSNFNEGHAFVKKDGELGLIDSLGNITRDYEVMKEYILPFSWADSEPKFNGEEKDSFAKWVNSKLIYPEPARRDKIQGKVHLTFIIDIDGFPKDVKFKESYYEDFGREAQRVVYMSPRWQPAMFQGKPYKTSFTFPVVFKLK